MVLIDSLSVNSLMETCVLLPEEFSLRVEKCPTLPSPNYSILGNLLPSVWSSVRDDEGGRLLGTEIPNPTPLLSYIRICASKRVPVRKQFLPFSGTIRTDDLPPLPHLSTLDLRNRIGSYDEIVERSGKRVRLCNWVRFVRHNLQFDQEVNIVATRTGGSVLFEVIREITEGEDLVVFAMPETTSSDPFSLSALAILRSSIYRQTLDSIMAETPLDLSKSLLSSSSKESCEVKPKKELVSSLDDAAEKTNGPSDVQIVNTKSNISKYLTSSGSLFNPFLQPHSAFQRYLPFPFPPPPSTFINPALSMASIPSTIPSKLHSSLESTSPTSSATLNLPENAGLSITSLPKRRERTMLPCSECGKAFDRPSLLKRHMRTHTGEKPHVCDVCGKGFSTSSSLNTHRRIHSGEKPHQCGVCGKRFTASSNLYYHKMTHIKEKPHKCSLCTRSFPTPGDLRSHMFVHNGQWPHKCKVCGKGFSKLTNLKNHAALHSGDRQPKKVLSLNSPESGHCEMAIQPLLLSSASASSSTSMMTPISSTPSASPKSPLVPPPQQPISIPPSPPISPPPLKKALKTEVGERMKHSFPNSDDSSNSAEGKYSSNPTLNFSFSSAPTIFSLMNSPYFPFTQRPAAMIPKSIEEADVEGDQRVMKVEIEAECRKLERSFISTESSGFSGESSNDEENQDGARSEVDAVNSGAEDTIPKIFVMNKSL